MSDPHAPLDPESHLTLDRAADLDEGLLSAAEAEQWRRHASGCAACQRTLAAVAGVREALGGSVAEPLDPALRARFDHALSDEAANREPALASRVRPARRQGVAKAVLALTAVLLGVFALSRLPSDSSNDSSSDAAAKPAAAAPEAGTSSGGTESASGGLSTSSKAARPVPADPSTAPSTPQSARPTPTSALSLVSPSIPSDPAGVAELARRVLAERQVGRATGQPFADAGRTLPAACLAGLGGRTPLVVRSGSFAGSAAYLVVQPSGADRVLVSVLRIPCGRASGADPLLRTTADAPASPRE